MRLPRRTMVVLAGLGLLSSLAGCGAEPPTRESDPPEAVAEEASALTTCVTIQRGTLGNVSDAQLVRRLGTSIASDTEANTNYGALTTAKVGGNGTGVNKRQYKSLLRFDLSPVPAGATVSSATVTLDTTNTGAGTVRVKRATAPWVEGGVTFRTWNNAQSADDVASFTAEPGAGGLRSFSVTALAQAWASGAQANDGLVLLEESPTLTFTTSEAANVALRPRLEVCYVPPDPCLPNPCENGGVCTSAGQTFTCACPGLYTGATCQHPPSACPCNGGIDWLNASPDLWYGCSFDATRAYGQNSQLHHTSYGAGFNQDTNQGYCYNEFDYNICSASGLSLTAAEGAICRDQLIAWGKSGALMCDGYVPGGSCDPAVPDPCFGNPCGAFGTCTATAGGAVCACAPGYLGQYCEIPPCPCRGTGGWLGGHLTTPGDCVFNGASASAYNYGPEHVTSFGTGYDEATNQFYCGSVWGYPVEMCSEIPISYFEAISCQQDVLSWGSYALCVEDGSNYLLGCGPN